MTKEEINEMSRMVTFLKDQIEAIHKTLMPLTKHAELLIQYCGELNTRLAKMEENNEAKGS